MSYLHGQMKLESCAVDSGTVLAKYDLLFLDTNDVKPAGDFTWDTDLATTQAGFADVFMGVCYTKSADGDTDPVSVDTAPDSVYEFACASAAYESGDTLGPDKASGNALVDQTLEAAVAASSVAFVMERESAATTRVKVSFASAYHPGSANANAALG